MSGSEDLLYRCGCAASGPVKQTASRAVSGVIDTHCHLLTPEVAALVEGRPEVDEMRAAMPQLMGQASFAHNVALEQRTWTRISDARTRLADMDLMGVATQVISPAPTQYHYWADSDLAERIVKCQNRHIARLCAEHPGRFLGFGAIALQHVDLALQQLTELMRAGFKGVEISSNIAGRDLSAQAFEPFWERASALGAVIFIHPLGSSLGPRLADDYLANTVGQPVETTVALSQLIFGGVLDRYPKLKLLAAHGGGYLPGFLGRSDHAHQVRPDARRCEHRPSSYLSRIHFDSVVHSPDVLWNLIRTAGVSQVVVGSDYPYDMGEYRLADLLADLPQLADADRTAILSGNARRILGLDDDLSGEAIGSPTMKG